jgi:hypothetical protein
MTDVPRHSRCDTIHYYVVLLAFLFDKRLDRQQLVALILRGTWDVLHIFTFMENHKTFANWLTKYENVKTVPSLCEGKKLGKTWWREVDSGMHPGPKRSSLR